MLKVIIKTLDSSNHSFTVHNEITVRQFKEHIAIPLEIPADKQRLIFCGKVLKDEKLLIDYNVDGKVIHVVQSVPCVTTSDSSSTTTSSHTNYSGTGNAQNIIVDAAEFLVGAFTVPNEINHPHHIQNIVQDIVSRMGEFGRNATVMSRESDDGSIDVQINLGRIPPASLYRSETQVRMDRVQAMLTRINLILDSLEINRPERTISDAAASEMNLQGLAHVPQSAVSANNAAGEAATYVSASNTAIAMDPQSTNIPIQSQMEPDQNNSYRSQSSNNTTNLGLSGNTGTQLLANLLDEVITLNRRMQPVLENFRDLVQSDSSLTEAASSDAQQLFSRLSQLIHFFSHVYHSLSDFHINFSQPPPRRPRVRLVRRETMILGNPLQERPLLIPCPRQNVSSPNLNTPLLLMDVSNSMPVSHGLPVIIGRPNFHTPRSMTLGPNHLTSVINSTVAAQLHGNSSNSCPELMNQTIHSRCSSVPPNQSASNSEEGNSHNQNNTELKGANCQSNSSKTTTASNMQHKNAEIPSNTFLADNSTTRAASFQSPPQRQNHRPAPVTSIRRRFIFDPSLPCQSVWALEPSHHSENSTNENNSQIQPPPLQQPQPINPNAPETQDQLQHVISNIMSECLSYFTDPTRPSNSTAPDSSTPDSTANAASNSPDSVEEHITNCEMSPHMPQSQHLPREVSSVSRSSYIRSYEETIELLEFFRLTDTKIVDVMEKDQIKNDDMFMMAILFLLQNLSFRDVVDITFGNFDPLVNIMDKLVIFTSQKIMKTDNPNDYHIEETAGELAELSLQTYLKFFLNAVNVRPDIVFKERLLVFLRSCFKKLLNVLLGNAIVRDKKTSVENKHYGKIVVAEFQSLVLDFLEFNDANTTNGNNVFRTYVLEKIEKFIMCFPHPVQKVIRAWYRNCPPLFVTIPSGTACVSPSALPYKKEENEGVCQGHSSKHYDENVSQVVISSSSQEGKNMLDSKCSSDMSGEENEGDNIIPKEWVPIVAQDVEKQKELATPAPLSDAYLSGVPSKRRKLL